MNNELRQDIVSGDWIVISSKSSKRPDQFTKKEKRIIAPVKGCPFENPQQSGHKKPILIYPTNTKKWRLQIFENKYPTFSPNGNDSKFRTPKIEKQGPYSTIEALGYHNIVVTRDHHKNFAHLSSKEANLVFQAFQERYKMITKQKCSAYVSIFHNWGPKAGASIYHPHYQIISIPVVPPDIKHSLNGSTQYFKKNKKCVHCSMIAWEKKNKKRIVYENKEAIVFTPFVSREPFEMRIFPKKHFAYFEDFSKNEMKWVVEALQKALIKIEKNLHDADYNFFIHTAPILEKNKYPYYHWHIEIQPKISISAGFELGTGIEVTVVDPDEAAKILRR